MTVSNSTATTEEMATELQQSSTAILFSEPYLMVLSVFTIALLLVMVSPKFGRTLVVLGSIAGVTAMIIGFDMRSQELNASEENYQALAENVTSDISEQYYVQEAVFQVSQNTIDQLLNTDNPSATIDIQVVDATYEYILGLTDDGDATLVESTDDAAPAPSVFAKE